MANTKAPQKKVSKYQYFSLKYEKRYKIVFKYQFFEYKIIFGNFTIQKK